MPGVRHSIGYLTQHLDGLMLLHEASVLTTGSADW